MEQDRTYWRLEPDTKLIEAARYSPTAELCIVLGERLASKKLDDLEDALYHAQLENQNLRDTITGQRLEIDEYLADNAELRVMCGVLEGEITRLEGNA